MGLSLCASVRLNCRHSTQIMTVAAPLQHMCREISSTDLAEGRRQWRLWRRCKNAWQCTRKLAVLPRLAEIHRRRGDWIVAFRRVCSVLYPHFVGCLWRVHYVKNIFWVTVCKTVRPMLSHHLSVCPFLSVTLMYCGQAVGLIEMKLGVQVGLSPGHIVLDGDPAPLPQSRVKPPIFGPYLLWPNGWMDQDATWYGGRTRPRRLCVRWGTNSPSPKGGAVSPSLIFGPCPLWPNGWMD